MAEVEELFICRSFCELFSTQPLYHFDAGSIESLSAEIRKFYSEEDEEKHGVVGIKISVYNKITN